LVFLFLGLLPQLLPQLTSESLALPYRNVHSLSDGQASAVYDFELPGQFRNWQIFSSLGDLKIAVPFPRATDFYLRPGRSFSFFPPSQASSPFFPALHKGN